MMLSFPWSIALDKWLRNSGMKSDDTHLLSFLPTADAWLALTGRK
jgi:hypothetical protein